MKYVKLNDYQLGLVFRNGTYLRLLEAGGHWLRFTDEVYVYEKAQAFNAPCELNILLKDAHVAALLDVLVLHEGQIALLWENGIFKSVLTTGRYAFWKGVVARTYRVLDLDEVYVPADLNTALITRTELLNYIRVYPVESYERGLLFIDGRFEDELQPGVYFFWKNARPVVILKADMRQLQLEVNGQEILTADKANLRLNFVAHYRITDIQKALLQNKEYEKQLYVLLQLAYREYIGNLRFDELLEKKEAVADYVKNTVFEKFAVMGVELMSTGIRDIVLPGEVKEIMNQVLVAEKRAQANIIMRREETASTRSLLNTAKLMEDNQMLFKLKEMEYVEKIAEKISSISVGGDSRVLDQLKQLFTSTK